MPEKLPQATIHWCSACVLDLWVTTHDTGLDSKEFRTCNRQIRKLWIVRLHSTSAGASLHLLNRKQTEVFHLVGLLCLCLHLCVEHVCSGSCLGCQVHFCLSWTLLMKGKVPVGAGLLVLAMTGNLTHCLGMWTAFICYKHVFSEWEHMSINAFGNMFLLDPSWNTDQGV